MKEHLIVKVESWVKEDTQKTHGLVDEDSLYVVHSKKVQINERFTVYDKDNNRIVDTTIDEVLKDVDIKTKKGWVKQKQNVWEVSELDYGDKRRLVELYKNYYPGWFKSFEIYFPEVKHKTFEAYYELFMKELEKHKQNIK